MDTEAEPVLSDAQGAEEPVAPELERELAKEPAELEEELEEDFEDIAAEQLASTVAAWPPHVATAVTIDHVKQRRGDGLSLEGVHQGFHAVADHTTSKLRRHPGRTQGTVLGLRGSQGRHARGASAYCSVCDALLPFVADPGGCHPKRQSTRVPLTMAWYSRVLLV